MTAVLSEELQGAVSQADPGRPDGHRRGGRRRGDLAGQRRRRRTSPAPSSRSTAASAWATDDQPYHLRTQTLRVTARPCLDCSAGKRLLITGIITDQSIAFSVAKIAQEQGAHGGADRLSAGCRWWSGSPSGCRSRRRSSSSTSTNPEHLGGAGRQGPRARRRPRRGAALDRRTRRRAASAATSWTRRGRTSPRAVHVSTFSYKSLAMACAAADAAGWRDRRADLRRDQGLAGLRLDGRRQGRPGVDEPLPGPATSARRGSGQPGLGRSAAHDGRQVDPRLRAVRGRLGQARPRSAGTSPTPSRPPRPCWP